MEASMADTPDIEFSISTDQACFIIIKAREFEVKEWPSFPDQASNPSDDRMVEVLETRQNDPVFAELTEFINALDDDAQTDLVALAWVGRGDFGIEEWQEARAEAARAHNDRTAEYLLGMPLLPDFLEEALSAAGRSCEDVEREHL
jgi:hypothetical protein